jgi:hypothetical protein
MQQLDYKNGRAVFSRDPYRDVINKRQGQFRQFSPVRQSVKEELEPEAEE